VSPAVQPFGKQLLKQRYRILARAGSGGYGQVYEAIDTEFMQRRVAIKEMIQRGLSARDLAEATEGFKREATILAALTHPNLPSIYDFFDEGGNWYVVMSFIEGKTLDDYLRSKGGRLPVEKVLQIGIQLAGVLSYLHTRRPPIIFRDLKPTNVMRTPEGQIYLIDFGIARHFKQGQAKDTMVLGSPGYAAPEQYGRAQTTPQADIYSLGAVLHELLSGKSPTQSPFSQKPLDLPHYPQLSNLIQCMLETDSKKRPASMRNIQNELQRILNGKALPITNVHRAVVASGSPYPVVRIPDNPGSGHVPPSPVAPLPQAAPLPPYPAAQSEQSGSWKDVSSVLPRFLQDLRDLPAKWTAGSMRAVSFLNARAGRGQDAQASFRQTALPNIYPQPVVAWAPGGRYLAVVTAQRSIQVLDSRAWRVVTTYNGHGHSMLTALAWSSDGTLIASSALDGNVHLWNSSNGRLVNSFRHADGRTVLALAWSPDGSSLALGDIAGSITLCASTDLAPLTTLYGRRTAISALAWSPDTVYLLAGQQDGSITNWRVSFAGSELLYTIAKHTEKISALACSPDGLSLASASWDHTVRLWNVDDGAEVITYNRHTERVNALAWSPNGADIASASLDRTVRIWRAPYAHDLFCYDVHHRPLLGVAWSSNQLLASVDSIGSLRIWQADGSTLHEFSL
jgi:serine/threonine protein kinase